MGPAQGDALASPRRLRRSWTELQRDLRDGPDASIRRLLEPSPAAEVETQVLAGLRLGAISSDEMDRLKSLWLLRVLYSHNPLGEP